MGGLVIEWGMHEFLAALREGCRSCGLDGKNVLIAVSGGADSVALLRGLCELQAELRLRLHAAHLNHQLRGDAADADARWIADLCGRLDVPATIGTADVQALADESGNGVEEAARRARYAFLEETAAAIGCTHLAVAHTADDQAETILHHILRGTGLAGLRGMPAARPLKSGLLLVRPLLAVDRPAVLRFLADLWQDYRHDPSNADPAFTRNRIRERLLPLLEAEFNPQIREALRKLGRQAAGWQEQVECEARILLQKGLTDATRDLCRIDCEFLQDQPRHVVRECFALLWRRQDWPRREMGFAEWERLAELAANGGTATLPGAVRATRRGNLLVLERTNASARS
jgi:tRNA(Ile)-lysidine synthase